MAPSRGVKRSESIIGFKSLAPERRSELGQYPTPPIVARKMAAMFDLRDVLSSNSILNMRPLRLLDPGAGVGSLTTAFVDELLRRPNPAPGLQVSAFEIEPSLIPHLEQTLEQSRRRYSAAGGKFLSKSHQRDFIEAAVEQLNSTLFCLPESNGHYDCVILNPPYKKLSSDSRHRHLLRSVGIETSNLYTAFVALSILLLAPGGELVAITPRSFCNGPYFRPFRELLLREMSLRSIHVFDSRTAAFGTEKVLQENIIFHAVKDRLQGRNIQISASHGPDSPDTLRSVPASEVIRSGDSERFIHLITDTAGTDLAARVNALPCTLDELGLSVSTGRVVDFRSSAHLRHSPGDDTVPLIYPAHFDHGSISWPKPNARKPQAIAVNEASMRWLLPAARHVLVKRFSAKEERRRIVAAVFDPADVRCRFIGFENHVNYFHHSGAGMGPAMATGLARFLNSTSADQYFRQFNGHTQVNATDLRNMRYPSRRCLERLGRVPLPPDALADDQAFLDKLVDQMLFDALDRD